MIYRGTNMMQGTPGSKADEAMAILKSTGVKYWVSETLRLQVVQDAYYAQGREPLARVNELREKAGLLPITEAENKNKITQAKVSKHTAGNAIDIIPVDKKGNPWWSAPKSEYAKIAVAFKTVGFDWGGDWPDFPDLPHYEWNKK